MRLRSLLVALAALLSLPRAQLFTPVRGGESILVIQRRAFTNVHALETSHVLLATLVMQVASIDDFSPSLAELQRSLLNVGDHGEWLTVAEKLRNGTCLKIAAIGGSNTCKLEAVRDFVLLVRWLSLRRATLSFLSILSRR